MAWSHKGISLNADGAAAGTFATCQPCRRRSAVGGKAEVAVRRPVDLPDGLAPRFRVQPLLQKYSVFPKTQITLYSRRPVPLRGAARDVTDAGRDAVDAAARLTGVACSGRRRRVVLTPRRWCQVGGQPLMTVARKPITGESTV